MILVMPDSRGSNQPIIVTSVQDESFVSELFDRKSAVTVIKWSDDCVTVDVQILFDNGEVGEKIGIRFTPETLKKLVKALKKIEKGIK